MRVRSIHVMRNGRWQEVPRWRWFQYGLFTQAGRDLARAIIRGIFR